MIPKLHYISQGNSPEEHLLNIQNACNSGAELVQLRLKDVSEEDFLKAAIAAREVTSHFQTRLIINGLYKIARQVKADGVHLEKSDVCPSVARRHLYTWQIIGATANTLEDCDTAIDKDVDYISLGPFRSTQTVDTTIPALGLNGYTTIIGELNTETPIIGFGKITTDDVTGILKTGISGLAVSDEITRDFNTIKVFNQLLSASSTEEQRHTFK